MGVHSQPDEECRADSSYGTGNANGECFENQKQPEITQWGAQYSQDSVLLGSFKDAEVSFNGNEEQRHR